MFGVFTYTLTHFLAKHFFPEGMGVEIAEGWEGGVLVVNKKITDLKTALFKKNNEA